MPDRAVRRAASARRRGQADGRNPARRARRNRRGTQAGPGGSGGNDPVLASRSVAVRYRAGRGDARQGEPTGHRPDVALPVRLVANARMYAINARVEARWRELFAWIAETSGVSLDVV